MSVLVSIGTAGVRALWKRRDNAVLLAIVAKSVGLFGRAVFVEGLEITENETDLILFGDFGLWLSSTIRVCWIVARKDHIVDEFGDAFAVGVVEDLAEYTLEEGLVLKLDLLFTGQTRFFTGAEGASIRGVARRTGWGGGADEAG